MGPRRAWMWSLLMVLALLAAACGGAGEDPEAFCGQVVDLQDTESDADATVYAELAAAAPEELRADLERMAKWFEELDAFDEDDAAEAAFALIEDPEYQATASRIERYLVDECEIDADAGPPLDDAPEGDDGEVEIGEYGPDDFLTLGVPTDEVNAKVLELLGPKWTVGTQEVPEGNTTVLHVSLDGTVENALAACDELSAFLAGHSDAVGEALVRFFADDDQTQLAVNERIVPGDPGVCEAA